MRITHFVFDISNVTAIEPTFTVDGIDPASRDIEFDFYPFPGDVHANINGDMHVFQGATQLGGSAHMNAMVDGSVTVANVINTNGAMKMTGSMSAAPVTGDTCQWGTLMLAQSVFGG